MENLKPVVPSKKALQKKRSFFCQAFFVSNGIFEGTQGKPSCPNKNEVFEGTPVFLRKTLNKNTIFEGTQGKPCVVEGIPLPSKILFEGIEGRFSNLVSLPVP